MAKMAPFETFREHAEREKSDAPYNEAFISRCREAALEYNGFDRILRAGLLQDLETCVPIHYKAKVFDGISNYGRM